MKVKTRESGIEILKIIAMFLIVLFHVSNTFGRFHTSLNILNKYFFNSNIATTNIQYLIIMIFKHAGALGNDIFFIASAWFLIDSSEIKINKIIHIIVDVWIISMIFYCIFLICRVNISTINSIKSIAPIITQSNWYITCYIVFYLIHVPLNKIINSSSQKKLLIFNVITIVLYTGICFISDKLLFNNRLVRFVVLYFIVAYAKKHMYNFISDRNKQKKVFILSLILLLFAFLSTNFLGLKITFLRDKALFWAKGNNPLIILIAFSLFNIFRSKNFVNKTINKWSSMTLLIYVLHENVIFRTYLRPYIFVFIKDTFGYKYIVLWIIAIAIALFIISSLIGLIYTKTIQKITRKIANKLEILYNNIIDKLTEKIMKIN